MRVASAIELDQQERTELTRLSRAKTSSVRLVERARIVLLAAQGLQNREIAEKLGIDRMTAECWRQRYLESGLEGIERDLPRGAPPVKVDVARLVELTTQSTPEAATHWSTRKMAAVLGVAPSTVMRHWQAHGLGQPWPCFMRSVCGCPLRPPIPSCRAPDRESAGGLGSRNHCPI